MAVSIIVGGQFGSEGKGKVAAYLADEYQVAVRTGGPNAGHTIESGGILYKLQSLPCAIINPDCRLMIGAGGVIDIDILLKEVETHGITEKRLCIDPQAILITQDHVQSEVDLTSTIGSTGKGVGYATISKISRRKGVSLAKDSNKIRHFICNVAEVLNDSIDNGLKIMVEGTQGYGLSLHHGIYPFVTSRDTTAAAFLSEAGISPLSVDEIVLVIRTFPIRVAGNSGPLANEISWDEVTRLSGYPKRLEERTTVTNRVRRVGEFDLDLVVRAVKANRPTKIALNFLDYIDAEDFGKKTLADLTPRSIHFVQQLENALETRITFLGTGPHNDQMIDRR